MRIHDLILLTLKRFSLTGYNIEVITERCFIVCLLQVIGHSAILALTARHAGRHANGFRECERDMMSKVVKLLFIPGRGGMFDDNTSTFVLPLISRNTFK